MADAPKTALILGWALAGLLVGTLAQVGHVRQIDGLEGTLRVGEEADARFYIADELGRVPVTRGTGHDGYQSYIVARDPLALDADQHDFYLGYRYRRLLSPLLSGLGGLLGPRATLWGLSITSILGFGLAAGAVAAIAQHLGARTWAPIGSIVNVGAILSVQLVTPDALATGLALAAAAAVLWRRTTGAALLMAAALLAKETSVLFLAGLVAYLWLRRDRRGAAWMAASIVPVALWTLYVHGVMGGGFETQGNVGFVPFGGIAGTIADWLDPAEKALGGLALLGLALAAIGMLRARQAILWAIGGPWLFISIMSSTVVWGGGNNAVRVFSILWTVGVLGVATSMGDRAAPEARAAPAGDPG